MSLSLKSQQQAANSRDTNKQAQASLFPLVYEPARDCDLDLVPVRVLYLATLGKDVAVSRLRVAQSILWIQTISECKKWHLHQNGNGKQGSLKEGLYTLAYKHECVCVCVYRCSRSGTQTLTHWAGAHQ